MGHHQIKSQSQGFYSTLLSIIIGDVFVEAIHETEIAYGDDSSDSLIMEILVEILRFQHFQKLMIFVMGDCSIRIQP